jgi:MoaA/NifB/PqqE/SkfB family radical SAM enzyme
MERPVELMDHETFRAIADKVKAKGLKIGAMFCFGEPLSDRDLFNKIRYGREIDVMTRYLGLNTNVALLTPEKYDDILDTCSNITLSFVTTGDDFERLTKLSWPQCYGNATDFIRYRDKHRPGFQIEIGCNDVTGHDRPKVEKAFAGYRVKWARDAEINWYGDTITGIINRSIMYHKWTCDGYKGAMQIKPNGDCCFCAYDVIRSETRFANILTDDWPTIEANFKALWKEPSTLCVRCDFWWNYKQAEAGGWKRGPHIDDSWQDAYDDEMSGIRRRP